MAPAFLAVQQFLSAQWKNIAIAMLLAVVSMVGISELWRVYGAPLKDDVNVAEEWNKSILKLGIVPVFPPEEDIQVGDIFAVIKLDRRKSNSIESEASLNRSIKIYSADMRQALQKRYDELPIFPKTVGLKDPKGYWEHSDSESGIFENNGLRKSIAIAAFPSFTIKRGRSISGGIGGIGTLLGRAEDEGDSVEVKILGGETYGISSIEAEEELEKICANNLKAVCSDEGLRRQLSHIAPDLSAPNPDPLQVLSPYAIDVELVFVNRVYLARSITQKSLRGRSSAGLFGVASPKSGNIVAPDVSVERPASDEGEQNSVGVSAVSAARQQANVVNKADPVAAGGSRSEANSDIGLEAIFQRPVVIGYRAVRKRFEQLPVATAKTSQPLGDWSQ